MFALAERTGASPSIISQLVQHPTLVSTSLCVGAVEAARKMGFLHLGTAVRRGERTHVRD